MDTVKTEDSIGMVLAHDISEIVPGKFKGVAFKKGHTIEEGDIEKLLNLGKENIYVLELAKDDLHENDAAIRLGNIFAGDNVYFTDPSEGKINLKANTRGLLKINRTLLDQVNNTGHICLATIHENILVEKDDLLGGCRIIPLTIKKEKIDAIEKIVGSRESIFQIKSFLDFKVSLIITGSEVYKGRITDKFGPVIENKLALYGSEIFDKKIVKDDTETIKRAIFEAKEMGAQMIIVTGGMSVDPDDRTPGAIKETGADLISYGTPVLPGAMLLFAYLEGIPIFGLPGCVMFARTSSFDLLLPRVLAGEKILKSDISKMGYGGQCLSCEVCNFPHCHFGKH